MSNLKIALLLVSVESSEIAYAIQRELPQTEIYTKHELPNTHHIASIADATEHCFAHYDALIYIGAMGICVRSIAPFVAHKHHDPAVINIDSTGRFVVSVLSGHVGGANTLTEEIARILGAQEVISTKSDCTGLWAVDTLDKRFEWSMTTTASSLNHVITLFVNRHKTALLLEVKDEGTNYLQRTLPSHVTPYFKYEDIPLQEYDLLIAVTPYVYNECSLPVMYFHPKVLHLGIGCRKQCNPDGIVEHITKKLEGKGIALPSIASVSTIELKKDEPLLHKLVETLQTPKHIFTAVELEEIEVPNPSTKVESVTSSPSVSEASAILAASHGLLIVEKQKHKLSEGNDFTYAVALDRKSLRSGHIEIVGAGPGDPELVSVRGKHFLQEADLILYAGSLVPIELTHYAKSGAVVRSSASMSLEEQFDIMKQYYDQGGLVVRLHTGDPCIYGAIQEQMALFDAHGMQYHITPGISSFQAAAAALRSQFTIPEKVQTIILTRGEGRTPMPEREQLHLLARSQSTMCIFLSAGIVDEVQRQLLEHYPPTTPVAACYKLTWKDEKIYRGELQHLAQIVKENNLTLTTMIVVGEAIDNRQGLSRLYADEFKHLFRH